MEELTQKIITYMKEKYTTNYTNRRRYPTKTSGMTHYFFKNLLTLQSYTEPHA